jgi:hypothetical protein
MIVNYDIEDIRDITRHAALLGLDHRQDVVRVTPSPDPESRLVTVEMTSGKAYHVEINIEVTEA